jgi:murein DD-endopeptidase MepM/ murein hydrolase activator NlpD
MEKPSLPKLETEGFVTRQIERPTWKRKAQGLAQSIGMKREKPKANADDDIDIGYKRLLAKTGVCAAVAVTILIISSLSTPATANVTQAVDYVVNHEFDVDEDIGRLKFVEALDGETESVFSAVPDSLVVYPADGDVVTAFGEGGSTGVRMSAQTKDILNMAKGTVTSVGDIGGEGYVEVVLDSGETVVYHNLTPEVKVDDIVMPGQVIGEIVDNYIYMEMKDGDAYIDPIAYIKEHAGMVLQ